MNWHRKTQCNAFLGHRHIAGGRLADVLLVCKPYIDAGELAPLLLFKSEDSTQIEVDWRGSEAAVLQRLPEEPVMEAAPEGQDVLANSGPGRPKLGVVAREVTLLPRHWDWLRTQPGGASVALRKLVETARRASVDQDRLRVAQGSAYRFMSVMAGRLAGFEEATRALFAGDVGAFLRESESWPRDVREHARALAVQCLPQAQALSD